MNHLLSTILSRYQHTFHPVVQFDPATQHLLQPDFTKDNTALTDDILGNTEKFTTYIEKLLGKKYTYGVGGYNEHRTIYARSEKFGPSSAITTAAVQEEPRRLHLGIDVWGAAGTPVFAPFGGYIHSFAFNGAYGDYGATIILHHQVDTVSFNTLYGHLSQRNLDGLQEGKYISRGVEFAHFGEASENGHWPPHLHFQLVQDMYQWKGDYPGVCKYSEREKWLANSPDPDVILQMRKYVS